MEMMAFEDFKLNKQILDAVADAGYTVPTLIQRKAIPSVLSGQDVMGIAQTGTGKTAAFVLPILMKLKYAQGQNPRALILCPTRELVLQLEQHFVDLGKNLDLRVVALYGGLGPKTQIKLLESGVDILVSTPGRFLDLYLENHIVTKEIKLLVMDEADKMMDMGFIGKLHRILEVLPRKRQNLLFSATMSELVHKISGDFLAFPVVVEASEQATPAQTVEQQLYKVPNVKAKIRLLETFLKDEEEHVRLIVFCRTRTSADGIFSFLKRKLGEDQVKVIHANKGQNTRINSINSFKEGEVRVLVATDVAARGLDIFNVSHVINFDVPIVIEDYVHRIGRTGRAFNTGVAITFCNPAEEYFIKKIEKLIRQEIPVLQLPDSIIIEETPFAERQEMAREIDHQKRIENPDFKGAFHEKRHPKKSNTKTTNSKKGRGFRAKNSKSRK